MKDLPDHPVIQAIEAKGYPEDPKYPTCPVCGQGCDRVYWSRFPVEILGCDACIEETDAWEVSVCFPEE